MSHGACRPLQGVGFQGVSRVRAAEFIRPKQPKICLCDRMPLHRDSSASLACEGEIAAAVGPHDSLFLLQSLPGEPALRAQAGHSQLTPLYGVSSARQSDRSWKVGLVGLLCGPAPVNLYLRLWDL